MANGFSLGEPEFFSTTDLRNYCTRGRNLLRPLASELQIASAELHAALKEVPSGDSRIQDHYRARVVAKHMQHAAKGVELSITGLVRTFLSFERNFLHSTPARSKKAFRVDQ